MNYAFVGFMAFCWLGLTLINRIMQGQFVTGTETAAINSMQVFRNISVFNFFALPVPNLDFIKEGIVNLVTWDYSFFGGNAALIAYMLNALSIAFMFMMFVGILGLLYNYFGRAK